MNRFLSACILSSVAWTTIPALGDTAPEPAPVAMANHHAIYKLTLLRSKGTSAPASAAGIIDYDFTGSDCAGYTTVFRQLTEMQPAEGDSKVNDVRSTAFESGDATRFDFKTKTSTDDDPASELAGEARRGAGGAISVDVKQPPDKATFAADSLFPTQHLRRVIAAAQRGDKILSAEVFDGSDTGKKLYHTLTVIGAPLLSAVDDAAAKVEAMAALRRWPVVISYFEGDRDQPDYVLSFDLYDNGISRALKLDYGEFVLAGALEDLKVMPQAACPK